MHQCPRWVQPSRPRTSFGRSSPSSVRSILPAQILRIRCCPRNDDRSVILGGEVVRSVKEADAARITEIYNHYILNTLITSRSSPSTGGKFLRGSRTSQ